MAWSFYSWLLARPPAFMRSPDAPTVHDPSTGTERPWTWAEFLLVQMLFGLVAAGMAAGIEQAAGAAPMVWDTKTMLVLAFVALGPSLLAYRCWGLGVARGGPTLAALFGNLTPVFAGVMSAMILGEWPRWYHLVAFAMILGGILWSTRRSTP
jgi:drug/metabolite transporter (DMT)-like permease